VYYAQTGSWAAAVRVIGGFKMHLPHLYMSDCLRYRFAVAGLRVSQFDVDIDDKFVGAVDHVNGEVTNPAILWGNKWCYGIDDASYGQEYSNVLNPWVMSRRAERLRGKRYTSIVDRVRLCYFRFGMLSQDSPFGPQP
jgi:hypothetical protein